MSPERVSGLPRARDGTRGPWGEDALVDLRPVVWDATMVTPRDDRGVTVVLRVTYRTIEQIILDQGALTESTAIRSN